MSRTHLTLACALVLLCRLATTTTLDTLNKTDHKAVVLDYKDNAYKGYNNYSSIDEDEFSLETGINRVRYVSRKQPSSNLSMITSQQPPPAPTTSTSTPPLKQITDDKNSNRTLNATSMSPGKRKRNKSPLTKNKMGIVNAFVGHLLVHRIPEDTFYDIEDGYTRNLSLSVRYVDRQQLSATHWLQFDDTRQELFGVPALGNVGVREYLLTARDSKGGKVHHIVSVKVKKGPELRPQAQFMIVFDVMFLDIAFSAVYKRIIVEKLAFVFGHPNDTSIIRIGGITDGPTAVKWYNTTLSSDTCPKNAIKDIVYAMRGEPKRHPTLEPIFEQVFDDDLRVLSVKMVPLDKCFTEGIPPEEFSSTYSGVSATQHDPRLGAFGLIHQRVAERKLVSFVIPTIVVTIIIFTTIFVMYLVWSQKECDTEFKPCLRLF